MRLRGRAALFAVMALLAAIAAVGAAATASAEGWPRPFWLAGPDSCTAGGSTVIEWFAELGDGAPSGIVVDGVPHEGSGGTAVIECGHPPAGWTQWAARYGIVPERIVSASALAPDGERVVRTLALEYRMPLSPPTGVEARASAYGKWIGVDFATLDTASAPERTTIAIRWREQGEAHWRTAVQRAWMRALLMGWSGGAENRFSAFAPHLIVPGCYEVQAARVYDPADLADTDAIAWSEPPAALVVSLPPEMEIAAEATYDSITVHLPDDLDPANAGVVLGRGLPAVDSAVGQSITWRNLQPGGTYRLRVWRRRGPGSIRVGLRTEPAPPGYDAPPDYPGEVEAIAHPASIELAWPAPAGAEGDDYEAIAYFYASRSEAASASSPAAAEHRVVLEGLWLGSTYTVVVRRRSDEETAFESRFTVETPELEAAQDADAGPAPPAAPQVLQYFEYFDPYDPDLPSFYLDLPDDDTWERVEYGWTLRGRTVRGLSGAGGGINVSGAAAGNYRFRARGWRDGAWSGWSDWTAAVVLQREDGRVFSSAEWDPEQDLPVPRSRDVRRCRGDSDGACGFRSRGLPPAAGDGVARRRRRARRTRFGLALSVRVQVAQTCRWVCPALARGGGGRLALSVDAASLEPRVGRRAPLQP